VVVETAEQRGREPEGQAAREAPATEAAQARVTEAAVAQVTEAAVALVATAQVAGSSARLARRRRTPAVSARVPADAARTRARTPETARSVRVSSGAPKIRQHAAALSPSCGSRCPATSASSCRPCAVTWRRTYRDTAARKPSSRLVRGSAPRFGLIVTGPGCRRARSEVPTAARISLWSFRTLMLTPRGLAGRLSPGRWLEQRGPRIHLGKRGRLGAIHR
jgi:hypothetical protein